MSLAAEVTHHLPFLRRYARALTGSQSDGDRYVRTALEALVKTPEIYDANLQSRVALYRVFQTVWSRRTAAIQSSQTAAPGVIGERLGGLAIDCRQALLLTSMEQFSRADAATILGSTPEEIDAMVEEAVRELMAQPATSVLIIEDEPLISLDLSSIIEEMGHTVAGVASTRAKAVALARSTRPGIILADIQLADGSSGVDAVHEILTTMHVPVIFITAFPERLLTGERPEPTFLVTKPFAVDSVKSTVGHALLVAAEAQSDVA